MAGMPRKQIETLLTHAEAHGCTVTPVKRGFLIRFPDGGTTTVHLTTSDVNTERNVRAEFKRHQVPWPRGGGKSAVLHKDTVRLGDAAMRKLGHPEEVRSHQLLDLQPTLGKAAARNYLTRHLGYTLVGNTRNARYVKPQPIQEAPVEQLKVLEPAAHQQLAEAPQVKVYASEAAEAPVAVLSWESVGITWQDPEEASPLDAIPDDLEPSALDEAEQEAPAPESREFLDTADSWTVDLARLPSGLTLDSLVDLYSAAGLLVEVRVWRDTLTS